MSSVSIYDQAIEILHKTHDGNDLAPEHLYLLQEACNHHLTESGEVAFQQLYKNVSDGYKRPWYHGIEHMTQDHEGFIYWKGSEVEHYSHQTYESADKAARELARRCIALEALGVKPTSGTAVWSWEKYEKMISESKK